MNVTLLSSIIIAMLLTSHSANAQDYQLPYTNSDISGNTPLFARSVFAGGVGSFFNSFNMPAYAEEFLPNNFFHMVEFLHQGNKTGKDKVYVKSVIRLFMNKVKASSYVNAYSFSDLLAQLPDLLEQHFVVDTKHILSSLKDVIYEIQYQSFKEKFPEFQANPESFLSTLSAHIEDAAELRKITTIFLELSLGKLIWSSAEQFDTWIHTKTIADQLATLYHKTIITDLEDLNSLYISLLERYCLFLELSGAQIDITTFEKIRADILNYQTPLLAVEEQETLLETKMQRLERCIIALEAKARAREHGIVIKG